MMNKKIICVTCGTQYNTTEKENAVCSICIDDRQYVPEGGQSWTDLNELESNFSVIIKELQPNLYEIKSAPAFAIGQRALLVIAPTGNVLWDCIALINQPTIEFIKSKGGLKAIAFSHPHYYTTMNEWAKIFDCPIYIHQKDEQWIFNKGGHVVLCSDTEKELLDGIKLINVGGHFPGSCILQVPFLSKEGTILCGDTFYISPSKKHAAVMYSYPNRIPLPVQEVQRIKKQMLNIRFDTIHGFYDYQNIYSGAKQIIHSSLDRYA